MRLPQLPRTPLWVIQSLAILLILIVSPHQSLAAGSDCEEIRAAIDSQQQLLSNLRQQSRQLEQLQAGNLEPSFELPPRLQQLLKSPQNTASTPLNAAPTTPLQPNFQGADCPLELSKWQTQKEALRQVNKDLKDQLQPFLTLPEASRNSVANLLEQWQQLQQVKQQVAEWEDSEESAELPELPLAIDGWIENWGNALSLWVSLLVAEKIQPSINISILGLVNNPSADIVWQPPEELKSNFKQRKLWRKALRQAHRTLQHSVQRWQNHYRWSSGWRNFFTSLTQPKVFGSQLLNEIIFAPSLLLTTALGPFYESFTDPDKPLSREALANGLLQLLLLVSLSSALLKLGNSAPAWLNQWQRTYITSANHPGVIRFTNGLLWFLKPNLPWIIVLVGTQLCCHFFSDQWSLFQLIRLVGYIFTGYSLVRVILEWMLARSYTRTEQFIATHRAVAQIKDARQLAAFWVAVTLVPVAVAKIGGGYLLFIIIVIWVITLWLSFYSLIARYPDSTQRFINFVAGNAKTGKAEQKQYSKFLWPLVYLVAHVVDTVRSGHQKLLVFDGYRAFSVKVIRLRLAAEQKEEDEDSEEETEAPADVDYSSWMLRPECISWIEVEGLEKLSDPIKHWANGNSNDNILLVVGDQGTGKTTLINRFSSQWQEHPISVLKIPPKTTDPNAVLPLLAEHLGFPALNDLGDLVEQEEQIDPRIVVIEDAHNLFLSDVGKLDAYRMLNQCLNAHLDNVFWVVVMHSHSWVYLNCVFGREVKFSNVLSMPRWSPADIRKLILSRHQGSRRRLSFNELLLSVSGANQSSSVRATNSRIYNILWEQSGGNPRVAIHLWLSAARSKERNVEIGVPEKPASSRLKGISDDFCFIYAAIIIHHELNTREIMAVTSYPEAIVRHALKQGVYQNMIVRGDNNRYRIHPLWQQTLFNVLASRNMLWS